MNPRPFAWTAGAILLVIGIAGFVPPLTPAEDDPLRIAAGVGGAQLLGLLPVGPGLSVLHAALGGWGLWAGTRLGRALSFARMAAMIFALLLILGTFPGTDNIAGLAPLYGNNLLLHGVLAIACALFGWLYRRPSAAVDGEELADA